MPVLFITLYPTPSTVPDPWEMCDTCPLNRNEADFIHMNHHMIRSLDLSETCSIYFLLLAGNSCLWA